jgi:hypothetical protein
MQFSGVHSGFIFHCTNPQDGVIKSYVKDKTGSDGMSGVKRMQVSYVSVIPGYPKMWRVKGKGSLGG